MKTAIVFIQIGNPLPKYAFENIKRTTQLFAREQFFLVVDETVFKGVPEELRKIQNLTFFISEIGKSAIGSNVSPKEFRQGFWQYTKLRLCTLRELHREYSQVSLLHIENDVLLLPDFLTFPLTPYKSRLGFPTPSMMIRVQYSFHHPRLLQITS